MVTQSVVPAFRRIVIGFQDAGGSHAGLEAAVQFARALETELLGIFVEDASLLEWSSARLARELRRHDLIVEMGDESFRLKKSLETATKIGARYAVIVGENEVKSGSFAVKDQATGQQTAVPRAELAGFLQKRG